MGSSKVEPRLVTVNLFFTQSKSMIYGMEQIQKLESYVAKYPAIDQLLVSLEQKTKVKKIYLLYGIVATVITWLMFGYGAQLLLTPSALLILLTAPSKPWNPPKKMMTLNGLCTGLSLPCFRFWNFSQTFS